MKCVLGICIRDNITAVDKYVLNICFVTDVLLSFGANIDANRWKKYVVARSKWSVKKIANILT